MVYLIVIVLILIGIAWLTASGLWLERKKRIKAVGIDAGEVSGWRDSRLITALRREVDWREGLTQLFLSSIIIALIAAAIAYGPGAYESGREWVLAFPERFAVYRIFHTVVAVDEERLRVTGRWASIYPLDNEELFDRLHAAVDDCSAAYRDVGLTCRTIRTLQNRADVLDVLSNQLRLILLEEDPQRAALPQESESFVPPVWRTLFRTVTFDNKNLMSRIRIERVARLGLGAEVRLSDVIAYCGLDNTEECIAAIESLVHDKKIQIIDDTAP